MRAIKIFVVGGMVVFFAAVLGAAYILFLRPLTLPVYHFEQKLSGQGDFMASTLTLGNTVYISDASETPLEIRAAWVGKNRMIGRTQDGMDIYAIPQQDSRDYIMLTTEMFPQEIFRNATLKPVQLSTFPADEIEVIMPQNGNLAQNKTRDPAVIKEVIDILVRREGVIKAGEAFQNMNVHLISDRLPGLDYSISATIIKEGNVFLADRYAPEEWIPAGSEFTRWVRSVAR